MSFTCVYCIFVLYHECKMLNMTSEQNLTKAYLTATPLVYIVLCSQTATSPPFLYADVIGRGGRVWSISVFVVDAM